MARSPRISVSVGRTVNMGNYETYRADVSYEDSLREGEDPNDAHERVSSMAHRLLDKEVEPVLAELNAYEKRRTGKGAKRG